jgi:hypothetical protein
MYTSLVILGLFLTTISSIPSPWFSSNSSWNAVLPDNAPLSPNSAKFVQSWITQVQKYGPWINVEQYSVPVYTVPQTQKLVTVNLLTSGSGCDNDLKNAFQQVPVPDGATPAAGTDEHLAIWQPSTNTMWEFWAMDKNNSTHMWECKWGGKMQQVSSNPGFYLAPCTGWGATATSLALTGGLLLIDELKSGVINHALALAVVETEKDTFVSPAERGDGWSASTTSIPEGTRFRLPASLNITDLKLNPFAEILAFALQKYGGLVRDTAGAMIASYCEPPPTNGPNPYAGPNGFFHGLSPAQILSNFPWNKLQVVDPSWKPWTIS